MSNLHPSFVYHIRHIVPLAYEQEALQWKPSRQMGDHEIVLEPDTPTATYFFDGNAAEAREHSLPMRELGSPSQSYTLYRDVKDQVHLVDRDATRTNLGAGSAHTTHTTHSPPTLNGTHVEHDWTTLKFPEAEVLQPGQPLECSWATSRQYEDQRLSGGGARRRWRVYTLPHTCDLRRTQPVNQVRHGLIGEVALLLGLLALTLPFAARAHNLHKHLGQQWRWPRSEDGIDCCIICESQYHRGRWLHMWLMDL